MIRRPWQTKPSRNMSSTGTTILVMERNMVIPPSSGLVQQDTVKEAGPKPAGFPGEYP
jgi:hypothetical protein